MRYKRQDVIWLSAIFLMAGLAFAGGQLTAGVAVLMVGLVAAALIGSLLPNPAGLLNSIQQRYSPQGRATRLMSQDARAAVSRAENRGGGTVSDLVLKDIGIIASRITDDGMVLRRARTVSKDDQGIRPYLVLQVAPAMADRTALLRFEILDQGGTARYVNEMEVYLRDGEMNVLVEDHLPMMDNDEISGQGEWDLRISLDGRLLAIHGFRLEPSTEERRDRMGGGRRSYITSSGDGERLRDAPRRAPPVRLEDLLRDQEEDRRSER